MKVKDLIEALMKCNPEQEVSVWTSNGYDEGTGYHDIYKVTIDKTGPTLNCEIPG